MLNTKQPFVAPFRRTSKENEGDPIFIKFVLDGSGSMDSIKSDMVDSFNLDCIGALHAVNSQERPMLRVSGAVFSDDYNDLWYGYRTLSELIAAPVRRDQLSGPGLGGETALYSATLKAYGQLVQASTRSAGTLKKWAQAKLIIMTDGANNKAPYDEETVHKAITYTEAGVTTQKLLFYFKTRDGLDKLTFGRKAGKCGFDEVFFMDNHGTDARSLQHAIRVAMKLLSEWTLSRSTPNVQRVPNAELLRW
jgi:hypothetical protein